MVPLLAVSCGLIVANLYFSQPLIALIAPDIGLPRTLASLIMAAAQLGYCAGLLFLVPLGDLLENRRLVLCTLGGAILALTLAATAQSGASFLLAAVLLGVGTTVVQMLVPIAAHLATDENRGRVVGSVMSGLLIGIMMARPVAGFVASFAGWRALFGGSAVVMALLGLLLRGRLPQRRPEAGHGYGELIGSLWTLWRQTPVLRRRAAYQAALFAAFSLYWTAVPIVLAGPAFGLSQRGIALFSLVGVAGALAAPVAGTLADRGHTRLATGAALLLAAVAFPLTLLDHSRSVALLLCGGVLVDLGGAGQSGARATGDLSDRSASAQPFERPLHGHFLRRWCGGLRRGQRGGRGRGLAARGRDRLRTAARGAAAVRRRIPGAHARRMTRDCRYRGLQVVPRRCATIK